MHNIQLSKAQVQICIFNMHIHDILAFGKIPPFYPYYIVKQYYSLRIHANDLHSAIEETLDGKKTKINQITKSIHHRGKLRICLEGGAKTLDFESKQQVVPITVALSFNGVQIHVVTAPTNCCRSVESIIHSYHQQVLGVYRLTVVPAMCGCRLTSIKQIR